MKELPCFKCAKVRDCNLVAVIDSKDVKQKWSRRPISKPLKHSFKLEILGSTKLTHCDARVLL